MIDLSSQHHDEETGVGGSGVVASAAAEAAQPTPQHDAVHHDGAEPDAFGRWCLAHEKAESAVQLLSRWAGPFVLLMVVGLLGWWVIH